MTVYKTYSLDVQWVTSTATYTTAAVHRLSVSFNPLWTLGGTDGWVIWLRSRNISFVPRHTHTGGEREWNQVIKFRFITKLLENDNFPSSNNDKAKKQKKSQGVKNFMMYSVISTQNCRPLRRNLWMCG